MRQQGLTPEWFEGAVSFERHGTTLRPWRLWHSRMGLFHDQTFIDRAAAPAGVRLRVQTDARRLGLSVADITGPDEPPRFDLTMDGELLQSVPGQRPGGEVLFEALPEGEKIVEIWLGQYHALCVRHLLVDDDASAAPAIDGRRRWVTYGSSITHAREAHSPSRTWPATAARLGNLNLTCLGYGGQCHLDPVVGRMIRDMPADVISLKLGINVGQTLGPRTFLPAALGLVLTIRDKHPDTPIAIVSPIVSPPRENTPGSAGLTLQAMREQLADVVRRLRALGDPNTHYISGLELFGEDLVADYLPDNLHPNADGQEIMGRNAVRAILEPLGF